MILYIIIVTIIVVAILMYLLNTSVDVFFGAKAGGPGNTGMNANTTAGKINPKNLVHISGGTYAAKNSATLWQKGKDGQFYGVAYSNNGKNRYVDTTGRQLPRTVQSYLRGVASAPASQPKPSQGRPGSGSSSLSAAATLGALFQKAKDQQKLDNSVPVSQNKPGPIRTYTNNSNNSGNPGGVAMGPSRNEIGGYTDANGNPVNVFTDANGNQSIY